MRPPQLAVVDKLLDGQHQGVLVLVLLLIRVNAVLGQLSQRCVQHSLVLLEAQRLVFGRQLWQQRHAAVLNCS